MWARNDELTALTTMSQDLRIPAWQSCSFSVLNVHNSLNLADMWAQEAGDQSSKVVVEDLRRVISIVLAGWLTM